METSHHLFTLAMFAAEFISNAAERTKNHVVGLWETLTASKGTQEDNPRVVSREVSARLLFTSLQRVNCATMDQAYEQRARTIHRLPWHSRIAPNGRILRS